MSYDSARAGYYDDHFTDIKLTFIQVKDMRRNVNFIPFIYQDKSVNNNNFLIYDIIQSDVKCCVSVNPPKKSLKYIYEDEQGFNVFSLCRTSDINEEEIKMKLKGKKYPKEFKK